MLDIKGFSSLEIGNWREELNPLDPRADVQNENENDIELVLT